MADPSRSVKRKQPDLPPTKRTKSVAVPPTPAKLAAVRSRSNSNGDHTSTPSRKAKPLTVNEVDQLRQFYSNAKEAELGDKFSVTGFIVAASGPAKKDSPHVMMTISDETTLMDFFRQQLLKHPGSTFPIKEFGEGKNAVRFLKVSVGDMIKAGEGIAMLKMVGMDVSTTTSDHSLTQFPVTIEFYVRTWSMPEKEKKGLWLSGKSMVINAPVHNAPRRTNKRNVVPTPPVPAPMEVSNEEVDDFPGIGDEFDPHFELPLATEYDLEGMGDLAPIDENDEEEQ